MNCQSDRQQVIRVKDTDSITVRLNEWDSQLRVDVVCEAEELLLTVSLCGWVSREQALRSLTAARLPDPLHTEPEQHSQEHKHFIQSAVHTSCSWKNQHVIDFNPPVVTETSHVPDRLCRFWGKVQSSSHRFGHSADQTFTQTWEKAADSALCLHPLHGGGDDARHASNDTWGKWSVFKWKRIAEKKNRQTGSTDYPLLMHFFVKVVFLRLQGTTH